MAGLQKDFINATIDGRVIPYSPDLARMVGGVNESLILQQFVYWDERPKNGEWFFKTVPSLQDETGLSRGQQDRAIKNLMKLGLVEKEVHGLPSRRFFKIDRKAIVALIDKNRSKVVTKHRSLPRYVVKPPKNLVILDYNKPEDMSKIIRPSLDDGDSDMRSQ